MKRSPILPWVLCGLMFFATALSFLDRQVLSILAPDLMKELRMTNSDYGNVVSMFTFTYAIMFTVAGCLVDYLGTRWGITLSLGIWSLASAAHGFVTGPWGLGGARMLLGLGEGGCFPAATKGACEWFPPEKRAVAIGIANGGSAFGAVVAPPLTAILANHFGWRGAFFATGLMGLLWLICWLAASRTLPCASSATPATSRTPVPWGQLLRNRTVWRILAARLCFDPVFYFYMFWIPPYLKTERGFSLDEIGAYYWIPFLALGISNIGSGFLSDSLVRHGWNPQRARAWLLVIAALITPVSGLVAFTPSAAWAIGLMAVLMMAHGIWICNFLAFINDRFPATVIATVVGLSGTVGGLVSALTSKTIGVVVDHFSFTPIFIASAVLYPLAVVVLLARSPQAHPEASLQPRS